MGVARRYAGMRRSRVRRTLTYSGHEPEGQSALGCLSNPQLQSPSGATVPRGMNA
jgi:hypothetical protein